MIKNEKEYLEKLKRQSALYNLLDQGDLLPYQTAELHQIDSEIELYESPIEQKNDGSFATSAILLVILFIFILTWIYYASLQE
jgi:hypothetical protein